MIREKEKRHKPRPNPNEFPQEAFLKEHPRRCNKISKPIYKKINIKNYDNILGVIKDQNDKKHRIDKLKRPRLVSDGQNPLMEKTPKHRRKHWHKYNEISNLKRQKESLQYILQQGTIDILRELEIHKNILNFNFNRLTNKVNIIFNHRNKRGAINGLGSIIKIISGNLDAADGESSIVSPRDLFNITKQIFDENKLSFQNFWSFSELIKSHCKLTGNMIRYLLEIPLYLETDYDLYQLTAIPTIVNNKIVTLNVPQQLIYKDNYKLFDITNCIFNNGYYCRTNFIEKNECISQLFQNHLNLEKIESFIKTQMQWQQIFSIKDTFNQMISISISLIEIIEEIETSLSFCNINLIHSSIVSPRDLFNITKQIFDENKLSFQNFWSFSELIKSHCKLTGNMIRYLLEIPLYLETDYDLYQLTAIPTIVF
ncbi:hypothetical protein FQA39_LY10545 [Lamprigera yunnana]|nr:hypothetical protein FQA39_LY10545 [Lamprigera yunnana]